MVLFAQALLEDSSEPVRAGTGARIEGSAATLAELESRGLARDLPLLWSLADSIAGGVEPAGLEEALMAILQRDGRSVQELLRSPHDVPEQHRGLLVSCTHRALGSRIRELWPSYLELGGSYERAVLEELPRLGVELLASERAMFASLLRPRLSEVDEEVAGLACVAAGQLEDTLAFGQLVTLVEDERPEVARKATWALTRLARRDLGASAATWQSWLEAEEAQLTEQVPGLLARATGEDEFEAIGALALLEGCVLGRHRVSRALVDLLWHPSERVAVAAAECLGELGSPDALPGLLATLERSELLVQTAAWRALRDITGHELPCEPLEWRLALLR